MAYEVVSTLRAFEGHVAKVRVDQVTMPSGEIVGREVIEHPGAVAVVALDKDSNIVLIQQYRHPAGEVLIELPAGLLDNPKLSRKQTAEAELLEEAGLVARNWQPLVQLHTSPGISEEKVHIFLATDVSASQWDGEAVDEEAGIKVFRIPLTEAVQWVLKGQITNSLAVAGILAASATEGERWLSK